MVKHIECFELIFNQISFHVLLHFNDEFAYHLHNESVGEGGAKFVHMRLVVENLAFSFLSRLSFELATASGVSDRD